MGKFTPREFDSRTFFHNHNNMLSLAFQTMLKSLPGILRCSRARRREEPPEPSMAEPTTEGAENTSDGKWSWHRLLGVHISLSGSLEKSTDVSG